MGEACYAPDEAVSFFSPSVQKLYDVLHEEAADEGGDSNLLEVFDDDGLLWWKAVAELMPALADPPSYGGTLSLCRPLRRLLRAADDARAALTAQRAARLRRLAARWLPFEPTCVRQMGRSWDRRLTTLHMAELCAAIDRGLGNILLLECSRVPPLLKDIVGAPELVSILGPTPVHLLRLLLGPPCTLNVRNLVWHGFPAPGELPPALLSLLLLLTAAVGALLADRAVPARRQLAYSQALLSCLQLPAVADCQVEDLWRLVLRSPFVPVVMRPHWRLALALYRHGRFGQGAVLLLPQLEHCLRLAFCALAGCPERRRTAEHRELYTTLDHLVAGGGGPLRALCGDAVLCQLCDLLVWPAGPRLRDRLAHGEVETARLPAPLAHQLLWLTGQLLVTTTDWAERQPAPAGGTAQHSGDGAEQQQYLTDRSEQQRYSGDWSDLEPVIRELEEADDCELGELDGCVALSETPVGGDECGTRTSCVSDQSADLVCGDPSSHLTPTSQCVRRTSDGSVLGCEDASVESSDAGAPCDRARCPGEFGALCAGRARDWYHPSFHQFSVLQRAVRDLSAAAEETVRRELPPEGRPALTRLEPLADGALSLRPPTLRRPRREAELLTQLQQLVAALDGAWRRAATAGATWRRLQEAGQLRSRQRATWGRMQSALPELHRLTAGLLRLVTRQMDGLATAASTDPDGDGGGDSSGRSLTRQNKLLLKLCENIFSSADFSRNHWLKVQELATEALTDERLLDRSAQL
ncbi:uncharacterized protein LOC122390985 isoform X2 [Amphibalanus amphitrite]|uniref:uncharacterized protein LOC122390985 isoform X2 n=1 Tax=Amphibalanus amphitrite TaxID=1232801 RepID=UPI001C917229|nr:uncharacterized protein LOC122390985 isoform X2 [Amphibalanus amphitrite]XP_043240422.1 uncharacterized protein LOC122390985 isoform X2 [Amphibalanus amphitrite]